MMTPIGFRGFRRPVEIRVSASVETDARLLPEERAPKAYSRSLSGRREMAHPFRPGALASLRVVTS
jgi:hypothetical protein